MLSTAARRALLARARDAVVRVVTSGRIEVGGAPDASDTPDAPEDGDLARPGAAFVTLHVGGELRGCIGTSASRRPLWEVVDDMATAAATRDPRFPPITARDLDDLSVEISVLSPERVIHDASEIEIGRHGLEVRRRMARGLLLPRWPPSTASIASASSPRRAAKRGSRPTPGAIPRPRCGCSRPTCSARRTADVARAGRGQGERLGRWHGGRRDR